VSYPLTLAEVDVDVPVNLHYVRDIESPEIYGVDPIESFKVSYRTI
jgi:hypothetical protein